MRELKYYVKGIKGNIEVTKGTFLNMQRKRNKKKSKNKIIVQGQGSQNKKIIIKQINCNIKLNKNKNNTLSDPKIDSKFKNSFLDTAQSKRQNQSKQTPEISEFCNFELIEAIQNQAIQGGQSKSSLSMSEWQDFQQNKNVQGLEQSVVGQRWETVIQSVDYQNEGQIYQDEQSRWSMINEHVEYMAMNLSLSYYDRIYGLNSKNDKLQS